ncbi:MAG TPA: OmpH family outer membrane protein [Bryobacteraceae bacterium]|nr:OmpH family outer membrane protein [Bryobacteraceae bacterium]
MRKLAGVCIALVLGAAAVSAQSKVGVVSMQAALLGTAEMKKAQADLEAKYRPRQQQIEQLQKDIQDLQAKMQSGKLSADGAADVQAQGQRKERELQRMDQDLREDVDRDRQSILRGAGQRMAEVVKKIADQKGLDVVIDTSTTYYFKPAMDITRDATAAYDQTYPVKP